MSKVLTVLAKAVQEDEESAAELMDQIAMEVIADEVEAHGADIEAYARPWMLEQIEKAKRGLLRGYVSKAAAGTYPDESYQQIAQQLELLTEVIKDDDDFDEHKHRRDARGRFTRTISGKPVTTVAHHKDHELSPANRDLRDQNKDPESPEARQQYLKEQGEWDDAQGALKDFQQTFPGSTRNVNAVFNFRTKDGGRGQFEAPLNKPLDAREAAAAGYKLDSSLKFAELAPSDAASPALKAKVARFNDIAGTAGPQAAKLLTSGDPEKLRQVGQLFGTDINPEASQRKGVQRFFNRTQAAGNVLGAFSGGEKYGRMVELAGEFGAEADNVLGPAAQRAAYRYRGTEKEADPTLRRAMTGREMQLVDGIAERTRNPDQIAALRTQLQGEKRTRGGTDPVLGSLEYRLGQSQNSPEPMLGDEVAMKVRSDVAAAHMLSTLPDDPRAAELSRLSGHILPSQGVIIDRDGDVTSQAVGYGEDHYLPFDLKNVRSLKGGQYVRTRMEGGPTGEDVYALVATGARMGTVVSSSGVFTLEMDPNFRGARGSGDKARMVYQRYLEILDAVDQSGMYVNDLSPADKARVEETAEAMGYKPGDKEFKAQIDAERAKQKRLSPDQIEQIEADARKELQDGGGRFNHLSTAQQNAAVTDLTEERVTEAKNALVRKLSLNAEGYALAMKTLQQQFPYFIRTASYEPLRDKTHNRGFFETRGIAGGQAVRQRLHADDKGYVRPRGLRSESNASGTKGTREGFYREAGRRQDKRQVEEESEEESTPAAAAAAPAAAAAATAAGTTTTATEPAPASAAPAGPLADALAARGPEWTNKRDTALSDLRLAWGALGKDPDAFPAAGGTAIPWADAKKRPDAAAAWLLDADPTEFKAAMDEDQAGVLDALSNRKAISQMVTLRAGGNQSLGFGDPEHIKRLGLPDVEDADSFARYVSDTAQRVVDYQQLANPSFFRTTKDPWETSGPMLTPDLATVNNQAALDAYAKQHPEQADLARSIGLDEDGRPKRFSDMKADVAARVKVIKPFSTFQQAWRSAPAKMGPAEGREWAVAQKLQEAGVDADQLGAAVGRTFANPGEIADWAQPTSGVPGADRSMVQIQNAWSLAARSRLVDFAEGGDLVPKDQPALAKLAKAAPLPRRVAVLPPSDPRSVVAKRLVADLPLPRGFRARRG